MTTTTNIENILLVGCSHSKSSGYLTDEDINKYLYSNLLEQDLNVKIDNRARDGSSNHEIFCRTVQALSINDYDRVIVQWSGVSRLSMHRSLNSDREDMICIVPTGTKLLNKDFRAFRKIYLKHFMNTYIEICNWLSYVIALQGMLKQKDIPYVFVSGFSNYLNKIVQMDVPLSNHLLNDAMEAVFDGAAYPDDVLQQRLDHIMMLISQVDKDFYMDFTQSDFKTMSVDQSDSAGHLGPQSNRIVAEKLKAYL